MAWRYGWFWGMGLYLSSLFWIGNSLWIDPSRFAIFWPLAVLGIPVCLACYVGVISVIFRAFVRVSMPPLVLFLIFCSLFSLMEFAQGHLWTGFPWHLVAYVWSGVLPMAQVAAFTGSYGLGLITVMLALMPTLGILLGGKRGGLWGGGASLGIIGLLSLMGSRRLAQPLAYHPNIALRLVQPGISQRNKNQPDQAITHLKFLKSLSDEPVACSHMIWPESALPWCWSHQTLENAHVLLDDIPVTLLTGGGFFQEADHGPWSKGFYNGMFMKRPGQTLEFVAAKSHLVPFGEYVPLRNFLSPWVPASWLRKITPGSQDYQSGPKEILVGKGGLPPFRVLICYESIFPGALRLKHQPEPQWALNLTNNAWFGASLGPLQHFQSTRFRAIEEGLPVVCVANTGPSGVMDPFGRVPLMLGLNEVGSVNSPLPQALPCPPFGKYKHRIWLGMQGIVWVLCLLLTGVHRQCRKKRGTSDYL